MHVVHRGRTNVLVFRLSEDKEAVFFFRVRLYVGGTAAGVGCVETTSVPNFITGAVFFVASFMDESNKKRSKKH